jgi:hypothetical protein
MVMIKQPNGEQYSMDGYLHSNLKLAKQVVKKDWDMLFAVDGMEGSGKSVFTQQAAHFCDPTLDVSRVVFTPKEFREAIMKAEKFQAVVYDEAYTGLSSRATMSLINRTLVSMIAEIRQRNLFVFVVMPTFFDLDKYIALWRSRALIHVYTGDDFQRGFFAFYNSDMKKSLYMQGKKFYSYSKPRPNFIGRFTNHYTVDKKEYIRKKRESLVDREKKREDQEIQREIEERLMDRVMALPSTIPHKLRMKILGIPQSTYFLKLRQWKEEKAMENI